jgi:hypothetical protein
MWTILAVHGWVSVGFALAGDADVGLHPQIIEDQAVWLDPSTATVVACIGELSSGG